MGNVLQRHDRDPQYLGYLSFTSFTCQLLNFSYNSTTAALLIFDIHRGNNSNVYLRLLEPSLVISVQVRPKIESTSRT